MRYLLILILLGCNNRIVKFKHIVVADTKQKVITYKFKLPKYVKITSIIAGNGVNQEKQFWYLDSSILYISTIKGVPNANLNNILNSNEAKLKRSIAFLKNDTLSLYGVNLKGDYWKNVRFKNGISIGYVNVHPSKIGIFEKMLIEISSKIK